MINPDPLARRIPGEGKRANAALRDYAAMGAARSLRALLERYVQQVASGMLAPTTSKPTLETWSLKNEWQKRVNAYDTDLQQQVRLAQIAAIADMNERHVNLARAMMAKVAQRLQALESSELSPTEVARWADTCSKLERLARGEATDRIDVFARVRSLARELGLTPTEEAEAVAAAEDILRGG